MLNERLQILVTPDQRRRLRDEAKRRKSSVAMLIREAIDARFGAVTRADRLRALEAIRAMAGGRFVPPEELDRLAERERDAVPLPPRVRRRR